MKTNATTITLSQGVLTVNNPTGLTSIQGPLVASSNRLSISGGGVSGSDASIGRRVRASNTVVACPSRSRYE